MASIDTTTLDPALKQYYSKSTVENLVYANQPCLATIGKDEEAGGRNIPILIHYSNTQGGSQTFSTAQTNATAEKLEDFLLTYKKDYSVATIDGLAADVSKGDAKSFLEGMTIMIDGAFHTLSRSMGIALFRDGSGVRGQISATSAAVSTASITLAHASQSTNFEVGMVLVSSADQTAGAIRTGSEILASINRSTGALGSTSVAWNTVASAIAVSDYLFRQGDYDSMMSGFEAWCPASAPGATAFYGVNRSVDTRLGGNRYDGSSQLVEEALIDGQSAAAVEGAKIDTGWCNHVKYRELVKSGGSKERYDKGSRKAKDGKGNELDLGFRSVVLEGDSGPIDVMADINCPYNVAWLLQFNTWTLHSVGQAPKLLNQDGNRILRQASSDGYEVRVGAYLNLGCSAPGWNMRVKLAS